MPPEQPPGKKYASGVSGSLASIGTIGTNFALGVVVFAGIGWALERWAFPGAAPWLLLSGLGVGLFAGGYRFIREANDATRRANADDHKP